MDLLMEKSARQSKNEFNAQNLVYPVYVLRSILFFKLVALSLRLLYLIHLRVHGFLE